MLLQLVFYQQCDVFIRISVIFFSKLCLCVKVELHQTRVRLLSVDRLHFHTHHVYH